MSTDTRDLLDVLKSELEFLENGGYRKAEKSSWRAQFIFEDSSACLNFGTSGNRRPCAECILMQFVPGNSASKDIPCRYIPLNEQGETLDSLYRTGTPDEIEALVVRWLRSQIRALEQARHSSSTQDL